MGGGDSHPGGGFGAVCGGGGRVNRFRTGGGLDGGGLDGGGAAAAAGAGGVS